MAKYPGSSVKVNFEHRARVSDNLIDATTIVIVVKDSSTVIRVTYDATRLTKISTGVYRYTFIVPDAVLPGEWYAEITAGIDPDIDVKRSFFDVEE